MAINKPNGKVIFNDLILIENSLFQFSCNFIDNYGYWNPYDMGSELSENKRLFIYLDTWSNPIDGKATVIQLEVKTIDLSSIIYDGGTGFWFFSGTFNYFSGGDTPDLSVFSGSNTQGLLAGSSDNLALSFFPEAADQQVNLPNFIQYARNIDLYTKLDINFSLPSTPFININIPNGISQILPELTISALSYSGQIIEYQMKDLDSGSTRAGHLYITTDGTLASITDHYADTSTVINDIQWDANVVSGNVEVSYTTTTDKKMHASIKKFPIFS